MLLNKSQQPEVLLVCSGLDSMGISRFPRLLSKAGCRVILLSPIGNTVNRSRYVSTHIHASTELKTLVQQLKELLSLQSPPFAQVIIGDEVVLSKLVKYRGEDWLDGWFPVDHRSHAVDIMLSKHAFYDAMVEEGLYLPYSKLCKGWIEVKEAVEQAGYPVLLKSANGCAGWGVRMVHQSEEFKAAYFDLTLADDTLLVQQFCQGKLGATDILFDHGVPVCWQSSYKLECWPTPLSPSSARIIMHHASIEQIVTVVGKVTGFHGFCAVDWIHETDSDRIFLLEMNPRPTPCFHLGYHSGVDFSRSFKQLILGQSTITPPKPVSKPAKLIKLFPQGLYWAIDQRDLLSFIQSWREVPWDDPRLMISYLRRVWYYFFYQRKTLKA